jgi:hypothetical protein
MPKKIIDYSNTIIYKIYCKDINITDTYVGHTTNYIKRKYMHKISCNNLNNKLKIYNTIRENGGWQNWDMVEIAKYNCKNSTHARIKEQEHYELLKSTLNSCPPFVSKCNYYCTICNLQCISPYHYNTHINTNTHINNINNKQPKKYIKQDKNMNFYCKKCDYYTYRKSNLNNHFKSNKHLKGNNGNSVKQKLSNKFVCKDCNKVYKTNSGLWKHNLKICSKIIDNENIFSLKSEDTEKDQLICYLINERKELKNLILKVLKMEIINEKL